MKLTAALTDLCNRNVIQEIDLELCLFFKKKDPEVSDQILLAVCLLSYLYRQGDVCLFLPKYAGKAVFDENESSSSPVIAPELQDWIQTFSESSLVGKPGDFKPVIFNEPDRLYLHKLWTYEYELAEHLLKRGRSKSFEINKPLLADGMKRLFPSNGSEIDWQQLAAALSVKNLLSVISGGPGTGKTSTVVRILALLLEQAESKSEKLNIALAAPTGKAAARLKDSILLAKEELPVSDKIRCAIPDQTMTLHQLLGAGKHTSKFKFHKEKPLPYDLIIVDEASMIDQALMYKLMDALLSDTRLILLGDKDQLASVEAGSVLGDICDIDHNRLSKETANWLSELYPSVSGVSVTESPKPLTDNITLLTESYRFDSESGIAQLAESINSGEADGALKLLENPEVNDVHSVTVPDQSALKRLLEEKVVHSFEKVIQSNSVKEAMAIFNSFRLLSAHRKGPLGVEFLNNFAEKLLQGQGLISKYQQWYSGRPVIINENDYTLKLYNGDTGICLPDENGELKVFFEREQSFRAVSPARLPGHSTAYALTVHKSQGSEFDEIVLILPNKYSKVLSRELLYTALSRARIKLTIAGNKSILSQGINTPLIRSSGLRDQLWL